MTSDATPAAYEALMQFLYQAPIGLVQTSLDGDIEMINPMSSQLLMPLVTDGNLLNLFDALQPVAPQLRALGAAAAEPGVVLCDSLRVQLPSVHASAGAPAGPPQPALTLAVRMLRLDDRSLMVCLADVTAAVQQEQHRLASKLHAATRVDPLTQLPTRAVMLERIGAALQRTRADAGYRFAVLCINADRFNRVNMMLGHGAGDELLRLMAGRLNGTVRQHDAVASAAARLGGNEFVVLLDTLRSADDVPGIAQRLVDALCRPYLLGDAPVHVAASLGVVVLGGQPAVADGDPAALANDAATAADADADAVLQQASLAMREAKRAGGGRYCVFEPLMQQRAWRRNSLEAELRLALTDDQLFVVYQPIVDLQEGSSGIAGVEALVRWHHPQRGTVSPIEFIEIAEETGLIVALGAFVLNTACRQLAAWQRQLGPNAPQLMSVNLSRAQIADPTIAAQVADALQGSGLAPACLQLEVTESMAAQDQQIQTRLHELKALGLSLALDDFGTGYSSLSSLHQLPIDVVKIDRSFVCQAESSAHHRVLIEATVRVARSLQMRTVAEGIETAGQAAVLTALHCDKGQGYLYARPLTADAATRWLAVRAAAAAEAGADSASAGPSVSPRNAPAERQCHPA